MDINYKDNMIVDAVQQTAQKFQRYSPKAMLYQLSLLNGSVHGDAGRPVRLLNATEAGKVAVDADDDTTLNPAKPVLWSPSEDSDASFLFSSPDGSVPPAVIYGLQSRIYYDAIAPHLALTGPMPRAVSMPVIMRQLGDPTSATDSESSNALADSLYDTIPIEGRAFGHNTAQRTIADDLKITWGTTRIYATHRNFPLYFPAHLMNKNIAGTALDPSSSLLNLAATVMAQTYDIEFFTSLFYAITTGKIMRYRLFAADGGTGVWSEDTGWQADGEIAQGADYVSEDVGATHINNAKNHWLYYNVTGTVSGSQGKLLYWDAGEDDFALWKSDTTDVSEPRVFGYQGS